MQSGLWSYLEYVFLYRYDDVDSRIDLTFYNQVKARFSAEPGTLVFIDASGGDVEKLVPQVFTDATFEEYYVVMGKNWDAKLAFFAIDNRNPAKGIFAYICQKFLRMQDLKTGKVLEFSTNTFPEAPDMDKLKAEIAALKEMLKGDSEAA